MSMKDIEKLTHIYSDARNNLIEKVEALHVELESSKRRKMPGIKSAVAKVAEAQDKLKVAIEQSPKLFDKPRTHVMSGIRVGIKKGKGKLEYKDADSVIKKIKQFYEDEIGTLINTKEIPNKDALILLPADELKKLGITITGTGDQVLIKPTDSSVDKLVTALLKDAEEETEQEDAAA